MELGVEAFVQNAARVLEGNPIVADVHRSNLAPATLASLAKWLTRNSPHELPEELKQLYHSAGDGLHVTFSVHQHAPPRVTARAGGPVSTAQTEAASASKTVPLGVMHVNAVGNLVRIKDAPESTAHNVRSAYLLESSWCGRVVLYYVADGAGARGASNKDTAGPNNANPEVWGIGLDGQWVFIARSFVDYVRLMVLHFGLPGWWQRFTPHGMNPLATQWYALLAPARFRLAANLRPPTIPAPGVTVPDKVNQQGEPTTSPAPLSGGGVVGRGIGGAAEVLEDLVDVQWLRDMERSLQLAPTPHLGHRQ
jgi:tubulin polyglutamylase complex subunit 2